MKRRAIEICSVCIVAIIVVGAIIIMRPKTLGNINDVFSEPATSRSEISFPAEAGDKIKFSFSSKIDGGTLDIILYDSERNVVKELDRAKELETFAILDKDDEYTLVAEYSDFVGKFKVAVYDMK